MSDTRVCRGRDEGCGDRIVRGYVCAERVVFYARSVSMRE